MTTNEKKVIESAKELVKALLYDKDQTQLKLNTTTGKNEIELLSNLDKTLKTLKTEKQ
jgi:hypothetical protein